MMLKGWLPPHPDDVNLERRVNARLGGHTHVKLSRREAVGADDEGIVFVLVMCHHDARKVVEREYAWFTVDEIAQAAAQWTEVELPRYHAMDNWVIAH
jgi:hypothetical protein